MSGSQSAAIIVAHQRVVPLSLSPGAPKLRSYAPQGILAFELWLLCFICSWFYSLPWFLRLIPLTDFNPAAAWRTAVSSIPGQMVVEGVIGTGDEDQLILGYSAYLMDTSGKPGILRSMDEPDHLGKFQSNFKIG